MCASQFVTTEFSLVIITIPAILLVDFLHKFHCVDLATHSVIICEKNRRINLLEQHVEGHPWATPVGSLRGMSKDMQGSEHGSMLPYKGA